MFARGCSVHVFPGIGHLHSRENGNEKYSGIAGTRETGAGNEYPIRDRLSDSV